MTIAYSIPDDMAAEPAYRPIPWERFVAEFLEGYRPPLRAPGTYRMMKQRMGQVSALVAVDGRGEPARLVRTTADLTPLMVRRLLETYSPGRSPYSVKQMLACVRVACNAAVDSGYLRVSPFRRMPIGKLVRLGRPAGRRHLSRAEIRALLDGLAADVAGTRGWRQWKARRIQALAATIVYTGLRRNEALNLHVADVDLAARMIQVRPRSDHRLKTERSAQPVPMPPALVPILEDWLSHRLDAPRGMKMPAEVPWVWPSCRRKAPWREGPVGHKPLDHLKAAGLRAGVGGDVTFQMLRRSLATHLRHFGAGRAMVSRILRHSEAVDEAFYHEADADNLRAAVRDVEF